MKLEGKHLEAKFYCSQSTYWFHWSAVFDLSSFLWNVFYCRFCYWLLGSHCPWTYLIRCVWCFADLSSFHTS
jgi:hypothetical protein